MIPIEIDSSWTERFPGARMGFVEIRGIPTLERHPALEEAREALQAELRQRFQGADRATLRELPVMRVFGEHFRRIGQSYHVLRQLESVALKGREIPNRLCAVTALFMAELRHGLVAAGHDLEKLEGPLRLAASREGQRYRGFGGRECTLAEGDYTLSQARGLLSSVFFGPDEATPITACTRDVLCTIYAPEGVPQAVLEAQMEDTARNFRLFSPQAELSWTMVG